MKILGTFILVTIMMTQSLSANAELIKYDLTNVMFTDGGTLTGFFTYNTDADSFGDFELTPIGGNGEYFENNLVFNTQTAHTESTSISNVTFKSNTKPNWIIFNWNTYTGTPNTTSLIDSKQVNYFVSGSNGERQISSGELTISSVPEPSTIALFALGFAGIGFARRRRA